MPNEIQRIDAEPLEINAVPNATEGEKRVYSFMEKLVLAAIIACVGAIIAGGTTIAVQSSTITNQSEKIDTLATTVQKLVDSHQDLNVLYIDVENLKKTVASMNTDERYTQSDHDRDNLVTTARISALDARISDQQLAVAALREEIHKNTLRIQKNESAIDHIEERSSP